LGGSGTPCIFINASSDKPGMITNVNMGVAKLFGYPINEVRNHHVEKLMPEIYQKLHHKVVDDAITKGKENITHKERQIFGRNKNGYIFPVSIQIKMIHDSHGGV
jgi:two-component system sensor kinase FixL